MITVPFIAGLIGCSDSSSNSVAPLDTATTNTGVFIDAAVSGINYATESLSGVTNAQGEYSFLTGETVTFSIGDIDFPTVTAKEVVTPLDLANTTNINDITVVNIARLLISLDTDNNPDNGISLGPDAHAAATGMSLLLSSETFETDINVINLVSNGGGSGILVDETTATDHLESSLGSIIDPTPPAPSNGIDLAGKWDTTESYDICNAPSVTVIYSQSTFTYDSLNSQYTFIEFFDEDITIVDISEYPTVECTDDEKFGSVSGKFSGNSTLDASELKQMFDDSEVKSVVINSPDQFTVTKTFRTGLNPTDTSIVVTVTQIWRRL